MEDEAESQAGDLCGEGGRKGEEGQEGRTANGATAGSRGTVISSWWGAGKRPFKNKDA